MRHVIIPLALTLLSASAHAHSPADAGGDATPECMQELTVTGSLAMAWSNASVWSAFRDADTPSLLVGDVSTLETIEGVEPPSVGGVMYALDDQLTPRVFAPAPGETVVGVFLAAETGETVLFTQLQTEGPGQSWTFIRTNAAFSEKLCVEIPFPTNLNNPVWANETLEFLDFNVAEDNSGEIIARADIERDGAQQTLFYLYSTNDGGKTWSAPEAVSEARAATPGIFNAASAMRMVE